MKKKPPKSSRKFIRREKARIRRGILDSEKAREEIKKIYQKPGIGLNLENKQVR